MPPSASKGATAASDPTKKRVKTPLLLQMHATECSAACLGSVLAYFGRWAPLTELREKCEVSRDGSSAASILRAARHYGLKCSGLSLRSDQLKKTELPLILFWQFHHFLILEGFDSNNFYLNDPSTGRRTLSAEEFEQGYSNIALKFERTEDFKPGGDRPGMLTQLSAWRAGSWGVVAGAVACGLMLALLALVVPATVSVFVDSVLENSGPWGGLVAAFLGAGVLVYVLSLLKHRFLNRLAIRISVVGFNRGLSRLLRLPVEFFQHRLVGEGQPVLVDRNIGGGHDLHHPRSLEGGRDIHGHHPGVGAVAEHHLGAESVDSEQVGREEGLSGYFGGGIAQRNGYADGHRRAPARSVPASATASMIG
jgi:uncharacterized membrane protein YeaQ/YmgE (transglycosylase-associated protein family)